MKRHNLDDDFVDYLRMRTARVKMTNYLRTGNFKKVAGSPILGANVARRRAWLLAITLLILMVGGFYVLV